MAKTKSKAAASRPAQKNSGRSRTAKKSARTASAKTAKKSKEELKGSLLEEFFLNALKDMYWAEKALTKALPKMSKSATSPELKKTLNDHLEETKKQIGRLE